MMLTQADLDQFTGTETWYRHPFVKRIAWTEGVKYLADKGGAYWLIDEIVFGQAHPKVKREEFQVWKLDVTGSRAVLSCGDGNKNVVFKKDIPFTDFPMETVTIWFTNDVILLPSEY